MDFQHHHAPPRDRPVRPRGGAYKGPPIHTHVHVPGKRGGERTSDGELEDYLEHAAGVLFGR